MVRQRHRRFWLTLRYISIWDENCLTFSSLETHSSEIRRNAQCLMSLKRQLASQLRRLKQCLSKSVWAWKQFERGDIRYFHDEAPSKVRALMIDALRSIQSLYARLEVKLRNMESLIRDVGENNPNNLENVELTPGSM